MSLFRPWTWVGILAALAAGAGLARWWSSSKDDSAHMLSREAVIRIGYAVEAPYAFHSADGTVTGESPEIAREIARRLGIGRVEWRLAEFAMLIEGLETRQFDVIAAGMFVTDERSRRVTFSRPTFEVGSALLVRRGNPRGLASYASAASSPEVRLAVISGSVEERHLAACVAPPDRLTRVPDALAGKDLVRSGKVDALALSAPSVRWMARHDDSQSLECIELDRSARDRSAPSSRGAFAFRRADRALIEAWNRALSDYLGSDEHRQCLARFHFSDHELPPPLGAGATK